MNNYYLIGIIVSLAVYLLVGMIAGKKVKNVDDYYVAGHNAPTLLIVGSLVASFLSTGAFMGDTGEVYSGFFIPIVIVGVMQGTGYLFGSVSFGRYIRRSQVLTVPEYFGKRFQSPKLRVLAGITTIVAVTAYMLSAIQGIATLMQLVTQIDYSICVIIAWVAFAFFTIWSGSSGVLITDTIMFLVFLAASLVGIPFIVKSAGGWNFAIGELATSITKPGIISAGGNLDYLYGTGAENITWAITYGIVWALVVMISPWQTSRYLMAKNEKTVMKSAIWSSAAVIMITTLLYFSAAFVQTINPDLIPSQNMVWAAMNLMPKIVGVVMLTGILAAGISSASTFLSLIGFSLTNDLFHNKKLDMKKQLRVSRIGMLLASILVLVLAYFNPPQIFWIMYFGGTVIASSWAVVALGSVWSKKLSSTGAFWGMLLGFLGCAIPKAISAIAKVTLPMYLDPFFIGILMSVLGAVIGTAVKPRTDAEREEYELLHRPTEKVVGMKKYSAIYLGFVVLFVAFMLVSYVVPYMRAVG